MRAIVIAGGTVAEPAFYKPLVLADDFIICADSGYIHAEAMGLKPNLVIGDFDSSSQVGVPHDVPRIVLPVEKDQTDLHAAICYAIKQGATEILLFGARGTRLDHSLAAVSLVYMGLMQHVTIRIIDEHNELFMFCGSAEIQKRPGCKLSLMPLTPVTGIRTEGLYYSVDGADMDWGNPYGVSNEFAADTARVTIESGVMMVIISRD